MADLIQLLPQPRMLRRLDGICQLHSGLIALDHDPALDLRPAGLLAQQIFDDYAGYPCQIVGGKHEGALLTIQLVDIGRAEGYRLSIQSGAILLVANDRAGAFYGVQTLKQLVQVYCDKLPQLEIEDYPDFPARGVMLDISRHKVPSMETLFDLIDQLAGMKINQLQLYTEHTFAYQNHPKVWETSSPLTAEQILELDVYCRERFIELVPNQNSFGHMHHWLKLPEYAHLAETHERVIEWMSEVPFTLAASNPESLTLLESMYDELLPNFTSQLFNVGADETWDLGAGQSKADVDARGKGRVYLDFLLEIYQRVKARGRTMQFWGDIINQYPELVPEIPKDTIALEWGYEAGHPFAEKSELFSKSGIPFYVCPGTSSWLTIAGRTENMMGCLRNSIENGLKFGAIGVLNTDWGDLGHWQQLPISYAGFAYGAALSWFAEGNRDIDLASALSLFVFQDEANIIGKLAFDLGNAYRQTGVSVFNGTIFYWIYTRSLEKMRTDWMRLDEESTRILNDDDLLRQNLYRTLDYLDTVMQPLDDAQMERYDEALIRREFKQTANVTRHAIKRMLLYLGESMDKTAMLQDLDAIIEEQKALWLSRNRSGGLEESLVNFQKARELYLA
jgi:hexosaminidase